LPFFRCVLYRASWARFAVIPIVVITVFSISWIEALLILPLSSGTWQKEIDPARAFRNAPAISQQGLARRYQ